MFHDFAYTIGSGYGVGLVKAGVDGVGFFRAGLGHRSCVEDI